MRQLTNPILIASIATCVLSAATFAQTSSIGAKARIEASKRVTQLPAREAPANRRNAVYDRYSWTTPLPSRPRIYKVGDLLTIIVRERRNFSADAELETKKKFDVNSQLDAFVKLTQGGVGAADFRRGQPTVNYQFDTKMKGEADSQREDSLTTRLTGKIIDVKPNGLLVLEARGHVTHDDESSTITFTGTCRKEDVTADNTVLSTQVADKEIVVDNHGTLRANTTRGWIPKLLDLIKPF